MERVKFPAIKDGDAEDCAFLTEHEIELAARTGERLLDATLRLDEGLSGDQITRPGHSLPAATRARADGPDTDWVVAALPHGMGEIHAPYNHDGYAAAIPKPFVREPVTWAVEKHGDFRRFDYAHPLGGDRNSREKYRGHPCFDDCAAFCARWDQSGFDPSCGGKPVDFFRPMAAEVLARRACDPDAIRPGARAALTDPSVAQERARQ